MIGFATSVLFPLLGSGLGARVVGRAVWAVMFLALPVRNDRCDGSHLLKNVLQSLDPRARLVISHHWLGLGGGDLTSRDLSLVTLTWVPWAREDGDCQVSWLWVCRLPFAHCASGGGVATSGCQSGRVSSRNRAHSFFEFLCSEVLAPPSPFLLHPAGHGVPSLGAHARLVEQAHTSLLVLEVSFTPGLGVGVERLVP